MDIKTSWLAILLMLLLSCSGDGPSKDSPAGTPGAGEEKVRDAAPAAPAQEARAGSYFLSVAPAEATLSTTLGLKAEGFKLDEAEVVWLLNGRAASTTRPYHFDAPELDVRKGDTVQARAVVGGVEVLSNVVEVRNAPPELVSAGLVPDVFRPGDALGLEVEARDSDGDPVTIEYQWTVNGKPAGSGKTIGAELKRGDTFTVSATPFDGEERGQGISITREIKNLPPMFTQHNEFTFDGKLYTYAVKARDPDGDPLAFALSSSPKGTSIDPTTGLIKWEVPADFIGTAAFTVTASDGQGGLAEITLRFNLSDKKKEESGKDGK